MSNEDFSGELHTGTDRAGGVLRAGSGPARIWKYAGVVAGPMILPNLTVGTSAVGVLALVPGEYHESDVYSGGAALFSYGNVVWNGSKRRLPGR